MLLFQLLEIQTGTAIFSFFSRGRRPELSSSRTPSPGVPLLCCSRHEGNGLHRDFFSGSRVPSKLLTPTLGNCLFGTKWELNCADPRTYWGSHPPPGARGGRRPSLTRTAPRRGRLLSRGCLPRREPPSGRSAIIRPAESLSRSFLRRLRGCVPVAGRGFAVSPFITVGSVPRLLRLRGQHAGSPASRV